MTSTILSEEIRQRAILEDHTPRDALQLAEIIKKSLLDYLPGEATWPVAVQAGALLKQIVLAEQSEHAREYHQAGFLRKTEAQKKEEKPIAMPPRSRWYQAFGDLAIEIEALGWLTFWGSKGHGFHPTALERLS
jgi:hypothetical protein